MNGAGASFDLGSVQKNNVPPVANAGGFYSGNEGSPVTFNGGGSSSICGFPTLVWNFSDGGVAFGRNPQHTFTDNAVYSGELTAIDATGMTALDTFSATIANLPPVVHAGPDTTSAWGIWLAFNGSATDPGAADQATLTYSWSFGDGSPSASGGASTTHAYAVPGDYFATLTSCDKDGACASATRVVHVLRRNTRAAYTGDSLGVFDTTATLAGSLFDEFGLPVAGRTVQLQAGSAGPFGAGTDVAGTARQQFTVPLAAGSYTASVAFAGDTLYNGTSANDLFTVVQKATSVMYTGSLFGKPNKATALSAILTDSSGKALAGRAVRFDVGTQSATGTTDAQGVAVTSLVLTQKNGLYTLTATYAPAAADAPYYVGSADSAAFALQMK
jgi:PKD repeat protein